jgi:hypothetical protein
MKLHPLWLAAAVALAVYLYLRRGAHGRATLVAGGLAAVGAALIGLGVIELPKRSASGRICSSARSRSSRPARSSASSRRARRP